MWVSKRRLREALRGLADAVAQTVPGSGWNDPIDEALLEATQLVGPMDDDRALEAILARREADMQEAYEQGCDTTEAEYEETLAAKDDWIADHGELVQQLLQRDLIRWDRIPTTDELLTRLADYA